MRSIGRWLTLCCALPCLLLATPASAAEALTALREPGALLLMRHAATEAGVGDPPEFRPGECRTQRNLSAPGRAQARAFGRELAARGIQPVAVFSSAWCRCVDTARLAFPALPVGHLAALDSFFADPGRAGAAASALRAALDELHRAPPAGATVWVTHQVNISALTGEHLGMGDALVVLPRGGGGFSVIGRLARGG